MILDLIGKGLGLATKLLGGDSKVADAITTVKTAIAGSPETQAELKQLELEEMRLAMESEADIRKLYGLELQSSRGFVANARPAVLWIASGLIAINFGLIPLVNTIVGASGGVPLGLVYPEMPEKFYWLIGSLYTAYTGGRSFEKIKGRA